MCGSMADIQSAAAEIRRGKKKKKKKKKKKNKPQHENIYGLLFHRATINNTAMHSYAQNSVRRIMRSLHSAADRLSSKLIAVYHHGCKESQVEHVEQLSIERMSLSASTNLTTYRVSLSDV